MLNVRIAKNYVGYCLLMNVMHFIASGVRIQTIVYLRSGKSLVISVDQPSRYPETVRKNWFRFF